MRQLGSLTNWVMKFDPMGYMKNAETANLNIFESTERDLRDYTDKVMEQVKPMSR